MIGLEMRDRRRDELRKEPIIIHQQGQVVASCGVEDRIPVPCHAEPILVPDVANSTVAELRNYIVEVARVVPDYNLKIAERLVQSALDCLCKLARPRVCWNTDRYKGMIHEVVTGDRLTIDA